MVAIVVLLVLSVLPAYMWVCNYVALRALRKGMSYNVFCLVAGVMSPLLALILIEMAPDGHPRPGDFVETNQRAQLDDGAEVPNKFRSEILAAKLIDQTPVVQIDGPNGLIWLARDGVRKI